jgi:hypothetical protein
MHYIHTNLRHNIQHELKINIHMNIRVHACRHKFANTHHAKYTTNITKTIWLSLATIQNIKFIDDIR